MTTNYSSQVLAPTDTTSAHAVSALCVTCCYIPLLSLAACRSRDSNIPRWSRKWMLSSLLKILLVVRSLASFLLLLTIETASLLIFYHKLSYSCFASNSVRGSVYGGFGKSAGSMTEYELGTATQVKAGTQQLYVPLAGFYRVIVVSFLSESGKFTKRRNLPTCLISIILSIPTVTFPQEKEWSSVLGLLDLLALFISFGWQYKQKRDTWSLPTTITILYLPIM